MFKLTRYLKDYKKELVLGPLFKLLEAVFELIIPVVMASIIDKGIGAGDVGYIWKMGGVMVALGIVGLASALTCQYFAARTSQGFGTALRSDMYRHINTLSHAEIDSLGTASFVTRITSDVNQLQVAVAMLIRLVIRAPFLVVGATVMAMLLDLKLSLVFLAAAPLVALVLYIVMSRSIPFYSTIQKKLDRLSLITSEGLAGARVIRAFSRQKTECARFEDANNDLLRTSVTVGRISAWLNPLTSLLMNLAIVAILWFGGWRVQSGGMTQGEIIAFVNYITQISLALVVVANLVVLFTKASACAARVNEVFELQPSVLSPQAPSAFPDRESGLSLEFQDVSFSYHQNEEYALRHISFRLEAGQTLGVIGGTGSGKSTLAALISRFYDVTDGAVLLGGTDVRQLALPALRRAVGVTPQKAELFSGTIASNLRWGNADAPDEALWRALETAQAADFVRERPEQLDTPVQQGGKNLSGGQRQRLTIARALVSDPAVLILDDSASALDFATDAALRRALRQEEQKRTVVIISQRTSAVRAADLILVLDNGALVGAGRHEELLERCPTYREIHFSQLQGSGAGTEAKP